MITHTPTFSYRLLHIINSCNKKSYLLQFNIKCHYVSSIRMLQPIYTLSCKLFMQILLLHQILASNLLSPPSLSHSHIHVILLHDHDYSPRYTCMCIYLLYCILCVEVHRQIYVLPIKLCRSITWQHHIFVTTQSAYCSIYSQTYFNISYFFSFTRLLFHFAPS